MSESLRRPRILYVSPPWPYLSIRSLHVARALQKIGDVEVVVVDSVMGNAQSVAVLGDEIAFKYELPVEERPRRGIMSSLMALANPRAPYPHGIGVAAAAEQQLRRTADDYDLIWFFKLRTANMFAGLRWPRSVLDVDDLPSGVYATVANQATSTREKCVARIESAKWARQEARLGERFSALTVCSERDRSQLKVSVPVHVVPSGFEQSSARARREPAVPPRIGFIGLFDYAPNVEGVNWLVRKVWPLIKERVPEAQLRLVGRGSAAMFGGLLRDIHALGWIDDAEREIASWSLMAVPIHVGGGTRVKIAEGFSRDCPIVSTSVGAFGYEVESMRELIIADDPSAFAAACIWVIEHPREAAAMADRAYASFIERWTWDAIAPGIWRVAAEVLAAPLDVRWR